MLISTGCKTTVTVSGFTVHMQITKKGERATPASSLLSNFFFFNQEAGTPDVPQQIPSYALLARPLAAGRLSNLSSGREKARKGLEKTLDTQLTMSAARNPVYY